MNTITKIAGYDVNYLLDIIMGKRNLEPVLGKNEKAVDYKMWQYLPPFKRMHDYTRSQNLGQTYEGVEKYKSMSGGKCTGHGYGFEDLTEKELICLGHDVRKVAAEKSGADYVVDGRNVQMKCCINTDLRPGRRGGETARKFCVGGRLVGDNRYPGQDACVARGEGKYVRAAFENRERNGHGKAPEVFESPVSVAEAVDYTYKGKESFKMDMKDPNLYIPAAKGGLVVGVAAYAGSRMAFKARCRKKGEKMTWKHELKAVGIGSISAVVSTAAFLGIGCADRQGLRPDRPEV